ncbi:hypothetical protein [Pseudoalteromonas sp. P1-25]|uniref:hypothetical protein n=1 Tax=Pseudoalteromonas sp. P1-25 TaxID=1723758 RepID=UPI0006D6664D|nr:hypothetical protein [Pseudoalteromonas sp. P1-25]KPZ58212.1 hypothetical protein AN393_00020 [Pseudoalteromonas sp. P1-25]
MQSTTINSDYSANTTFNETPNYTQHTDKSQLSSLTKDESLYLNKKRKSWKFINPKNVFIFRDQPIGIFNHLLHIVSFLICSLMFISYLYLPLNNELIIDVGTYRDITPFERLVKTLLVGLVLFNLNTLKKKLKAYPVKRYWFAMASNSLFKTVILTLYYLLFLLLCAAFIGATQGANLFSAIELFGQSAQYEVFLIINAIILISIIWHSFSFCRKELKQ